MTRKCGKRLRETKQIAAAIRPDENARIESPERAAWQDYEKRRAQAIVDRQAVASKLGFNEDHSPVDARAPGRGSIKRSHRAEGRNWVD